MKKLKKVLKIILIIILILVALILINAIRNYIIVGKLQKKKAFLQLDIIMRQPGLQI